MDKKMHSKQPRRKYDEGCKTEALQMVTAGRSAADVARSLGIGENLLYKWRSEQKSALFGIPAVFSCCRIASRKASWSRSVIDHRIGLAPPSRRVDTAGAHRGGFRSPQF